MPRFRKFLEAMTEDGFYFNLIMIPFAVLLCILTADIRAPLLLAAFLPVLVYHYFLRVYVRKLSAFLFLTWIACIPGIFTAHPIVYTFFLGLICARSVRRRAFEESRLTLNFETICFPLVFLAALHVGADYLLVPQIRTFFHAQAVAVLLLALLYAHLSGVNRELELSNASSLQSTSVIADFAAKYILVYVLGFFVVLSLFKYVPFGSMLMAAGAFILRIAAFILGLFKGKGYVGFGESTALNRPPEQLPEMEPAPLWANILETVLMYALNIFVLVLLVLFVVFFFLRLYYGFYRKKGSKTFMLDEVSDIKPVAKKRGKRGIRGITDPVRRRFYRAVYKYIKRHKLNVSDTPHEMCEKLKERTDMTDLTALYEQVRYGG